MRLTFLVVLCLFGAYQGLRGITLLSHAWEKGHRGKKLRMRKAVNHMTAFYLALAVLLVMSGSWSQAPVMLFVAGLMRMWHRLIRLDMTWGTVRL